MSKNHVMGPMVGKADQDVLDHIAAEMAAGRDPFEDDEQGDGTAAPVASAEGGAADAADGSSAGADDGGDDDVGEELEAASTDAGPGEADTQANGEAAEGAKTAADQAGELSAEQLAAIAADDEANAAPAPAPAPRYEVKAPEDFDAKIAAAEQRDAAAFKQLLDGEIDAEAYAAVKSEVGKEIRHLEREQVRFETLQEANAQAAAQEQANALNAIKVEAKKLGLDYDADAKAQRQFNAMLDAVLNDPDNAAMSPAQIYAEANKGVFALRGIKAAEAPAPAPAPSASKVRTAPPAPPTLRNLPAASAPTSGDIGDKLSRLSGPDFEEAYSKLSPAQRAALLDD